ncbi:MAG: hypothetical protein LBC06_04250 [Rickettsiales bacterium]|nr:hypothetical protein [Rickettsiales bacterium]
MEREKEELQAELDRLQSKVERLTKENKDLSGKLKDMKNLLESQFTELEEVNKCSDNQVRELKNLLLDKSFERRKCEEALLQQIKGEESFVQEVIEYIVNEVMELIKHEATRGHNETQVAEVIQVMRLHLEGKVSLHFSHREDKSSDFFYTEVSSFSREGSLVSSTPKRTYMRNQSNNIRD